MLLSLAVYTSTSLILYYLGRHVSAREAKMRSNGLRTARAPLFSWEIITSVVLLVFVFGLRYDTGNDYLQYYCNYRYYQEFGMFSRVNFEPVFRWITGLFASSGLHYAAYFCFWVLLQVCLVYFSLRDRKFLLPWLWALLIMGPYCNNWLSFIRQWTVALIFLASIPLLEQRKFIPFAVIILLCMTLHKSAWLLLAGCAIPFMTKFDGHRKAFLLVFIVCVLLGFKPVWLSGLSYCANVVDLLGYSSYHVWLDPLLEKNFAMQGIGPLRMIKLLLGVIVIWCYPTVKRQFPGDRLLPIYYSLAFVAVCYENLTLNTSFFLQRPSDYLFIFTLIMVAYVVHVFLQKRCYWKMTMVLMCVCAYVPITFAKLHYWDPGDQSRIYYHAVYAVDDYLDKDYQGIK